MTGDVVTGDVVTGDAAAVPGPADRPRARSPRADRVGRQAVPVVAGLVLAVVATVTLVQTGSDLPDVLRYLLVWVGLVIVPGVLLWRATVGRSSTEIELGGGASVGLALLMVSWLTATALGHPAWAAAVPLAVLVAFVLQPRLRQHWRPRPTCTGGSRLAWWATMALLGVLMVHKVSLFVLRPSVLPPGPSAISSDAWYGLGIARELAQGFPVADPTFVGGQIRYHWFGIGLITATSQIARTDLVATSLHLWFVPFVVAWMLVVAALVRALLQPYEDSRPAARWWCWGPVAAALVVLLPASLLLTRTNAPGLGTGLNSSSASGAFGSLFVSALGLVVVTLLRHPRNPGGWAVAVLLTVGSAGIKPTVLPVVAAGCVLVGLWRAVRRSRGWAVALAAGAGALAVFSLASRVVVGSSTGTGIQPFALVVADQGYRMLYAPAPASLPGAGRSVLPAIAEGRPGAVAFAVSVVVLFLAAQAVPLLGLARAPFSAWRRDPAVVWVGGAVASGYAATYLVLHSGFSQQWFALNVTGTAIALTVAVVATEISAPGRLLGGVVAGALALGAVVAAGCRAVTKATAVPAEPPLTPTTRVLAFVTLAVVVAAVLVGLGVRRRRGGPALPSVVVAAAVLVGATLPGSTGWLLDDDVTPITLNPGAVVSAPQQDAALWLRDHSAVSDVVVSNVFCRPVEYTPSCDHTGVWLSALTGRRLVLDGWAYIPETMVPYDGTVPGPRMPSPFPERLRDSLAVVREGDRAAACRLTTTYGARWVYADRDATPVSSRLTRFADLRYAVGTVSVYRIDLARLTCPRR